MDRKHNIRLIVCAVLLALCTFSIVANVNPCVVSCVEADASSECQCVCCADPTGLPAYDMLSFISPEPHQSPTEVARYSLLLEDDIFRPPGV
jgi:hypothetical protein